MKFTDSVRYWLSFLPWLLANTFLFIGVVLAGLCFGLMCVIQPKNASWEWPYGGN